MIFVVYEYHDYEVQPILVDESKLDPSNPIDEALLLAVPCETDKGTYRGYLYAEFPLHTWNISKAAVVDFKLPVTIDKVVCLRIAFE